MTRHRGRCPHTSDRCPILRRCSKCGETFLNTGQRMTHGTSCKGEVNLVLLEEQHAHAKEYHNYRGVTGRGGPDASR